MPICHVNADDFGLHPDIDRGILACIDAGRVTGVSVAANGAAIDWSAVRSLAQRVQVGVHVTLVGEPWLTSARHFTSWPTLLPWLALPGRTAVLEAEVRAQVRAMLDADVTPTHLDSHQHVHVMPRIWPIVRRVATAHGIGRIRVPAAATSSIAKQSLAGQALQRLAASRRNVHSLPCIGLALAGHNTAGQLIEELEAAHAADPAADLELVAHPGIDTPALQATYPEWQFDWRTEQAALLSREWGEACERLGYTIAAPEMRSS